MNGRIALVASLATLFPLIASAASVDLVDLHGKHWAAKAVTRTVKAGVLAGFPDHTFRGWKPVSRFELIGATSKLLPVAAINAPSDLPEDVPTDHWAYPALQRFSQLDPDSLLWGDGTFTGNEPATRYELAYVAARLSAALSLAPALSAGFGPFADVSPNHWAASAVRQAHQMGLMSGFSDSLFRGDEPVDRYQLAIVLDKLIGEVAASRQARSVVPAAGSERAPTP